MPCVPLEFSRLSRTARAEMLAAVAAARPEPGERRKQAQSEPV
jgi:hypothetical protein